MRLTRLGCEYEWQKTTFEISDRSEDKVKQMIALLNDNWKDGWSYIIEHGAAHGGNSYSTDYSVDTYDIECFKDAYRKAKSSIKRL